MLCPLFVYLLNSLCFFPGLVKPTEITNKTSTTGAKPADKPAAKTPATKKSRRAVNDAPKEVSPAF